MGRGRICQLGRWLVCRQKGLGLHQCREGLPHTEWRLRLIDIQTLSNTVGVYAGALAQVRHLRVLLHTCAGLVRIFERRSLEFECRPSRHLPAVVLVLSPKKSLGLFVHQKKKKKKKKVLSLIPLL